MKCLWIAVERRYKNDSGFGTTGDCETLNPMKLKKLKSINCLTQKQFLRNSKLNFENSTKLINSLELKPNQKSLLRTNDSDESVLRFFKKRSQ